MQDLRFALRSLARSPLFTAIAVLTLALCIGANSAIFSVVDAVLLNPYPWPGADRLVYVYNTYPNLGLANAGISIPDYLDRRSGVAGFEDAAMYHSLSVNLALDGKPERIGGLTATPSLFTTLHTGASLGRVFTDADARPGADKVVVLSHDVWRNRFGGDPRIVGATVRFNAEPYTVIGVMPAGFYFPTPKTGFWTPFAFTDAQRSDSERGIEFSDMIARLKPGATADAVQRDLDVIQKRNAERLTAMREFFKFSGFGGRTTGFLEENVRDVRGALWLIQAGVAAALLIGCANVANLLLARALSRERELAIRAALGASRGRLVRLLLTESLVLFSAGGALGLLVAWWSLTALQSIGLSSLPRAADIQLDAPVFGFTLLSAVLTGLAFGALPAWSASRGNAAAALKEAGARGSAGRRTARLRAVLVVGEIALAVMLLSTAGLLVRSFERLQRENPGFSPGGVTTAQLSLPEAKYDTPARRAAFADSLLARLQALPGVSAAGFTNVLPFTGNNSQSSYASPDIVLAAGQPPPHGQIRMVTPGFFRALGLTLERGRLLEPTDTAQSPPVVVVDQLLTDHYWPGQDPIGKRIDMGRTGQPRMCTIVGVVAPVKHLNLEEDVRKETLYFANAQEPRSSLYVVIRSDQAAGLLAPLVRAAVTELDPDLPVYDLKTMVERMGNQEQARRVPMILLSLFSGVALLLAVLGVYGVLAFSVAQRIPEFGVRIALGATGSEIAKLVLRQGLGLVGAGVVAGLAGYLALSAVIGRLVYGIAATDPLTLTVAPLVLAAASVLACLVPVRRAIGVNPIEALRAE